MLSLLEKTSTLPLWSKLATTGLLVTLAFFVQVPNSADVPGEPFLFFFTIVACSSFLFGAVPGLVAAAATSVLSLLFFAPQGALAISAGPDVIRVEIYFIFAGITVWAVSLLSNSVLSAFRTSQQAADDEARYRLLLSEVAHRISNSFAIVAALIRQKSASVVDEKARSALEEAIGQVNVMARVHKRLYQGNDTTMVDAGRFLAELCNDLDATLGRLQSIPIECRAERHPLPVPDAVAVGLIVNELVTNAVKHAFPDGRRGRICVTLAKQSETLRLSVEDTGTGLNWSRRGFGTSNGRQIVAALAHQLGATIEKHIGSKGTSISIIFKPQSREEERSESALVVFGGAKRIGTKSTGWLTPSGRLPI